MPAHASPAAEAPPDVPVDDGLPDAWSASVRATYSAIEADLARLGDPPAAALAATFEACALLATAEAFDDVIAADGLVVDGSKGQPVAHPLLAESRLARTAALSVLARVSARPGTASAAGRALVSSRYTR